MSSSSQSNYFLLEECPRLMSKSSKYIKTALILTLSVILISGVFFFFSHPTQVNATTYLKKPEIHRYSPNDALKYSEEFDFENKLIKNGSDKNFKSNYFSKYTFQDSQFYQDEKLCRDNINNSENCLGPPYLYVTYHGGFKKKKVKTICKYTRDGCALGSALMPSTLHTVHSLRGMINQNNFLLVAESWKENSRILKYSKCNPYLGQRRELLEIFIDSSKNHGIIHPYGFAKTPDDTNIYISTQGTSLVLRYDEITGEPVPLNDTSYYPGTFVDLKGDEIRGIAFDGQGRLYVANKQKGVMIYNKYGTLLGHLSTFIDKPISIYYCKERNSIWVGSAREHTLYEFDASSWELRQKIKHHHLVHPAGFVTYGNSIFVVSQEKYELLEFSMITGVLENVVLSYLPDAGERVLLSHC